jgi:RimJ/RimL family protein N-acetyltransferase
VTGTLEPGYPLSTARLLLRPYQVEDLPFILDLFGREDVARYLPWEPMDEEAGRALLGRRLRQTRITAEGELLALAAVDPATDRVIGEFVLRLTSAASAQGEIGWAIHPDVQGRGLATEGAREMLRLGFDELGLHRIVAECDARHVASFRVMQRLGMRREALFREDQFLKGEWVGSIVCAMLASEWREMTGSPLPSA